jgi:hypothetical protein
MAAPHAFLVYSVQDAKGKISTVKINFPSNVDIGQVASFAGDTATMINNIIKGRIVDAGIGLAVDLSGATIRSAPDPDSDVEEGARFQFEAASGAITGFRLPTFDEAKLVAGTKNVDLADTDVDTFVDRILAGKTTGLVNASPSDDRGSDIVNLASARENFQSSRG